MIVSVTSLKGGVGKSTVTINLSVTLAHSGYKVCIVDTDSNQSSIRWSGLREESQIQIPVFGLPDGASLSANIKPLNNDYDVVIIDGTPSLSKITSKIILLADLIIIPILASGLDMWATELFIERFNDAQEQRGGPIPGYFLLNRYNPNTLFSKEVKEVLNSTGIPVLKNTLRDRVAYTEAIVKGLGVFEYKDAKAKVEFLELYKEIQLIMSKI